MRLEARSKGFENRGEGVEVWRIDNFSQKSDCEGKVYSLKGWFDVVKVFKDEGELSMFVGSREMNQQTGEIRVWRDNCEGNLLTETRWVCFCQRRVMASWETKVEENIGECQSFEIKQGRREIAW